MTPLTRRPTWRHLPLQLLAAAGLPALAAAVAAKIPARPPAQRYRRQRGASLRPIAGGRPQTTFGDATGAAAPYGPREARAAAGGVPRAGTRITAAGRLALVQLVAEHLADSHDLAEVLVAVVAGLREALGAEAVTIGVVERERFVTLVAEGFTEKASALLADPLPLEAGLPAAVVIASGEPIYWSSLEERDRDYPDFAGFPSGLESWAILPLVVDRRPRGALSLGWRGHRRFGRADQALLAVVGQLCATAVDRFRLLQAERAERAMLELLGEGTRLMVSALDPDQVVQRLVGLAVPHLAPWCAVYVAERDRLERVALEVTAEVPAGAALRDSGSVPLDGPSALARAYRSGETIVVERVEPDSLRSRHIDSELLERAARRQWTAMVVPVKSAGRVIGVMSLASADWAGSPPDQLRFGAEGLAGRAGVALANARRFEHERRTAELLTRALLPPELPEVEGYEMAARYLPAGSQVAGDWFDVSHLPSGHWLVGIGDAAGHGIRAASLMAQLRNAARGLAVGGSSPGTILHGLALLTQEDDPESFATALYGLLDAGAGTLAWASAGHIPPLRCDAAGAASYLEERPGAPLGLPATGAPADRLLRMAPGDALVLVTDGVVERRGVELGAGLEELRRLLEALPADRRTAADVADRVVAGLCRDAADDCCVVVLRRRA